ncbi:hypothetical protein EU545_02445 [Candidatus Thorarchaeota archaeon]|nr:MAG: hypothetical protein EU545_02445 [Candidatus Thorarchaeota archaeon]
MARPSGRTLRLVEIQESVLPEGEWLIGISDPMYFGGVGFSMPLSPMQIDGGIEDSEIESGIDSRKLDASSNLDDPIKTSPVELEPHDELLPLTYKHGSDPVQASSSNEIGGPVVEYPSDNALLMSMQRGRDGVNLYAFIPGIFYCSTQQTSVDGVLIEVIQKKTLGMTLGSFRPEDVRALDTRNSGDDKSGGLSVSSLGSFVAEPLLATVPAIKPSQYTIELAIALGKNMPISELKQAYVASRFLESRLVKLLEDIEFFGLAPRNRVYVRNSKHPYGTVVDVRYRGLDGILNLEGETGVTCPDEMDLTMELRDLFFSKPGEIMREVDIEASIVDILEFIDHQLGGKKEKEHVLKTVSRGIGT